VLVVGVGGTPVAVGAAELKVGSDVGAEVGREVEVGAEVGAEVDVGGEVGADVDVGGEVGADVEVGAEVEVAALVAVGTAVAAALVLDGVGSAARTGADMAGATRLSTSAVDIITAHIREARLLPLVSLASAVNSKLRSLGRFLRITFVSQLFVLCLFRPPSTGPRIM
jgi:hypothetical protein